jgi:cellobiose-specific phosphotransferase system component IIC
MLYDPTPGVLSLGEPILFSLPILFVMNMKYFTPMFFPRKEGL